jgi:hypothetical protein
MVTHRKKIDFVDIIFGGSATALPPLKFQQKIAYSWGKSYG